MEDADALRLNALRRVDQQNCTFACSETPRNLPREIDMALYREGICQQPPEFRYLCRRLTGVSIKFNRYSSPLYV